MSLVYISQQLTIYVGIFLEGVGVIGNLMNIFMFSKDKNLRKASSSFLFIVCSINNTIYLLFNLTQRILSTGFGVDINKYVWLCQLRSYSLTTLTLISLTCVCLASINQFLSTSRYQRLRQLSSIKWTYLSSSIMIFIWILHGIPTFIYHQKISPTSTSCSYTNAIYRDYTVISFFILLFGLPVFFLAFFGYLSYRNIHQIRALADRNIDRQLTSMTIMQAILVCFSTVPYGIYYVYSYVTATMYKNADQQIKEYFIGTIVSLISYLHFSVCLFFFFLNSYDEIFYFRVVSTYFCYHRNVFVKQSKIKSCFGKQQIKLIQ